MTPATPTSASTVAKWFLWRARQDQKRLSNKKLQKLVYYAQAWHLALKDAPLFRDSIQAWVHGPVVPHLYQEYKGFGFNPISIEIDSDPVGDLDTVEHLGEIWRIYGKFDADYLEILTHSEPPWQQARDQLEFNENSEKLIAHEAMTRYYRSLLNEPDA